MATPSVLGQEPIVPENLSKPTLDKPGITEPDLATNLRAISAMDFGRPAQATTLPVSERQFAKRLSPMAPVVGTNIMEDLAQDQSGWEQMAYLVPRALSKAAIEAAKLPGMIEGFGEWATTGFSSEDYGNAFNNGWVLALDRFNEQIQKEGLPVYVPQSVQDGNIFKKLASTSFWATEGADGVGFLLGMMAPGVALRALKLGANTTKLFSGVNKLVKPGSELETMAASMKTASRIDDWSAAAVNTVYEAGIEGQQAFNDYLNQYPGDVEGAGRAAKQTFVANNAILLGPNLLNQKWLFNGFKRTEQVAKSVGKPAVTKAIASTITPTGELGKLATKTTFDKVFDVTKIIGKGVLSEGFFEEGLQYATSERAKKTKGNLDFAGIVDEYIKDITADTQGNTEMWSGIILGGIMGGGMSSYGAIKQAKTEEKYGKELYGLLNNNYINYNKTYKDFAKTENGQPIYDKSGQIEIDIPKLIAGGAFAIKNAALRESALAAYEDGDQETYDQVMNLIHFDYMLPWLQMEGGIDLLKEHIKAIAVKEKASDEANGITDSKSVAEIEQSLVDKATKFQEIYNKINDTHDLSFDISKKKTATKDDIKSFSDLVKANKMSAKVQMDHFTDRVNKLKNTLSTNGVTSSFSKMDDAMVSELEDSYKKLASTKSLDSVQQAEIEQTIATVKQGVKVYNEARKALNEAFDKKSLNKAFDQWLTAKVKGEQNKTNLGKLKDPGLASIWNNANKKGNLGIKYTDASGKEHAVIAKINKVNEDGTLDVSVLNKKEDGTWEPKENITINNSKEIKLSDGTVVIADISSYATPEEAEKGNLINGSSGTNIENELSHSFEIASVSYEKDPKTPYSGFDSFLKITSNQDQAGTNSNVARFYVFVNNYWNKGQTYQGKVVMKYSFKTFHYNQMANQSDLLKDKLLFYVGDGKFMSYNEIQKADNNASIIDKARQDIKVVVVDAITKDISKFDDNGEPDEANNNIIFSSLGSGSVKTSGDFDRFSGKKFEQIVKDQKIKEGMSNKDAEEFAAKAYKDDFVKQLEAYRTFRGTLATEQVVIDITGINPGIRQSDNVVEIPLLKATFTPLNKLHFTVSAPILNEGGALAKHIYSPYGIDHSLISGLTYVWIQGNPVVVKQLTLADTNSVQDILNALRYVASGKEKANDVLTYLKSVIHMNTDNEKYKLFFINSVDNHGERVSGAFEALVFGGKSITADNLAKGEGVEELVTFLNDKRWNFSKKLLDPANKAVPFTEYKVNNKLEVSDSQWKAEDDGYRGFLFSDKNKNVPKGIVRINYMPQSKVALAIKPQFKNQSLRTRVRPGQIKEKEEPKGEPSILDMLGGPKQEAPSDIDVAWNKVKNGRTGDKYRELARESIADDKIDEKALEAVAKENYYKAYVRNNQRNSSQSFTRKVNDAKAKYTLERGTAITWFIDKFPDIPIDIVNGIINSKDGARLWGQLLEGSRVLISNLAEEGTAYHEAFHVWNILFNDEQNRKILYNETRKRIGNDKLTDREAEEVLAEEFRDFMLLGDSYKFNKGETVKQTLFQRILQAIRNIIRSISGKDAKELSSKEIENAFKKINDGTFYGKINQTTESFNSIEGVAPMERLALLKDINYNFFDKLIKDLGNDGDLLFTFEKSPEKIYDELYEHYESINNEDEASGVSQIYKDVVEKWDDFIYDHKLFLTQYKIDIRTSKEKQKVYESQEIDEDELDGKTLEHVESFTRPISDNIQSPIRLLVGSLKYVDSNDIDGKTTFIPITDAEFMTNSNVEYNKTMNLIINELTQITSPKKMMEKLFYLTTKRDKNGRLIYPELTQLYRHLGGDQSHDVMSETKKKLHMQFYSSFATNKNRVTLVTFKNDGKMTYADMVDDSVKEVTKKTWIENALKLVEDNKSKYIKYVDGDYKINISSLLNDLRVASNKGTLSSILANLGIIFAYPEASINGNEFTKAYASRLIEELNRYNHKKIDMSLNDLYDPNRVQNQGELNAMAIWGSEDLTNDTDLMYFNQDGNMEWSITRNSHLSEMKNRFNEFASDRRMDENIPVPIELQKHMPYNSTNGNLFALHSKYWGYTSSGVKIKFGPIKAIATQDGDAVEMDHANFSDYKRATFDLILRNIIPLVRAADRGPEYAFEATKTDYNIGENTIIDDLRDSYLYDELITSFALLSEINYNKGNEDNPSHKFGSNLHNYSNNAKTLRVFSFLFDKDFNKGNKLQSLESYVGDNSDISFEKLKSLTSEYLIANREIIDSLIKSFMTESMASNKESLLESMIIKDKGDGTFMYPGLNEETLGKLGIIPSARGTISSSDVNKMLRVHFYNYFVGVQEQLKMFLGDMASYASVSDFLKRTTSSASTKLQTANDEKTLQLMNRLRQKVNGHEHSSTVRELIISNIKGDASPELIAFDKAYSNMDIADGQMWGSLDFVRGMLDRNGTWSDEQERSFQYEMQKLTLEVLRDPELRDIWPLANESMFTDENGVFYNHTNGRIPGAPMFNGETIDPYDKDAMGQIPALKPLGAGYIEQEDLNVGVMDISKMSVAPIFPSQLTRERKKFLLSMMQHDIDSFGDPKSKKGDYYLNTLNPDNGDLVSLDSQVTQLLYNDYGIQNEVNTDEKRRITDSTQKISCIFVDMFSEGKLLPQFADMDEDIKERDAIINEVNVRNLHWVIKELGLVKYDDNSYGLPKENIEKFRKILIEMFVQRLMPDNIIEGLGYVLDSKEKVLDLFTDSNKVENVLNAFIKNNVIKRKVKGEMFVQESSWLYSRDLKFYEKGDKETSRAEVMIPIPEEWNAWVKEIGGIDVLNSMLENGKLDPRITSFIANRVPTASLNTIEAFTIKKFLPTYVGSRIILPAAIVAKTSSDFDIDKLFSYLSNVKITKDGPQYIEMSTENTEKAKLDRWAQYVYYNSSKDEVVEEPKTIKDIALLLLKQTKKELDLLKDAEEFKYGLSKIASDNGLMSFDEFTSQSMISQQSLQALENRMNEIHAKAILHKDRFETLMTPHSSDRIITLAKNHQRLITDLDKLEDRDGKKSHVVSQWWHNNRKAKSFWGGKQGLAIIAANNPVNILMQRFPIHIDDPVINLGLLFFRGQEMTSGGRYGTGHIKDANKNNIADNYGQMMVAAVDVAKNDAASRVNMNPDTLSMWTFLNSNGLNTGVGLDQIAAMMSHPIIMDFLNRIDISQSKFARNNRYTAERGLPWEKNTWFQDEIGYKSNVITSLIKKYSPTIEADVKFHGVITRQVVPARIDGIPFNYEETLASAFSNYIYAAGDKAKKVAMKKLMDKMRTTTSKFKYLSTRDITESKDGAVAIQILDNFVMYSLMSQKAISLSSSLRPYASHGFSKTQSGLETKVEKFYRNRDDSIFDSGDVDNFMENSFIGSSFDTYETTLSMYKWTLLTRKYPELAKLFNDQFLSRYTNLKDQTREEILRSARNQFMSFVASYYSDDETVMRNRYTELFTGANSLPIRLRRIKGKISNNALEYLRPVISEFSLETNTVRENHYITSFNKKQGVIEQNINVAIVEEMLESKDPEVRKFTEDFIEFSMYQNGIGNSHISYMSIIPNIKFIPKMDADMQTFLDKFFKGNDDNQSMIISSFVDQFMRNNYANKDIVHRYGTTFSESDINEGETFTKKVRRIEVDKKSPAARYDYITARYYTSSAQERKDNYAKGLRNPFEMILYKFDSVDETTGKYIFTLVEKLGDGPRFKEYYPTLSGAIVPSILKTNQYANIKPKVVEKKVVTPNRDISTMNNDELYASLMQLETDYNAKPIEELDNLMMDFFNAAKISKKPVDVIKSRLGKKIPAVAVSRLAEMTVEVIDGKRNMKTLPEEASHFYIAMLDENSGLYKSMFNGIVNYPIYQQVRDNYGEIYEWNEVMLREEAIGKLITDRMVTGFVDKTLTTRLQEQSNNWFIKLWNTIKEIFKKTNGDPYTKVAYDILNTKVRHLTEIKPTKADDRYQSVSKLEQWNEIPATSKGMYKYLYYRNINEAKSSYNSYVDTFGLSSVRLMETPYDKFKAKVAITRPIDKGDMTSVIIAKEDVAIDNMKELVKAPVQINAEQMVINFDTYFPGEEYLDDSEKRARMTLVENGELKISCKF